MQHIWIGEHEVHFVANPAALGGRGVAIEDTGPHESGEFGIVAYKFQQTLELILGKRRSVELAGIVPMP